MQKNWEFCLFYIKFVSESDALNESFWVGNVSSPNITAWRGFAYENVCFNHISEIKKALGIGGIATKHSAWWKKSDSGQGLQIDLIIRSRASALQELLPKKRAIHSTLITTYGLKENEYKWDFVNVITMEDLFNLG